VATLTPPLWVHGAGAVTACGLTWAQSAAAFVSALDGFDEQVALDAIGPTQVVAPVPADWRLKPDAATWLLNLAERAAGEAMEAAAAPPERTLVICAPPASARGHPCWEETTPQAFAAALGARLGGGFPATPRIVDGGPAALFAVLPEAAQALARGRADRLLLVGVDSLVTAADFAALRRARRLQGDTAQGLVPGEGAGAVVLGPAPGGALALVSVGAAEEAHPVTGERQSQGRGMQRALEAACADPALPERLVDFVVANFNGERYGGLEALIFRSRFYRTHREYMATVYPAMSFGETGSAGGVLALAMAAAAAEGGYAPGRHAMLEVASDGGLRAAALLRLAARDQDQAG